MSTFKSQLMVYMQEFLELRESQGFSTKSYIKALRSLDGFYYNHYPTETNLTKTIVMEWIDVSFRQSLSYMNRKISVIRNLGKYMADKGLDAYIIPDRFITDKRVPVAYIFTDDEMKRLFNAIDNHVFSKNAFAHCQFPVLLRLIYTCGLRPQEGRTLEHDKVNITTGEILITKTKGNKDRIVVMSDDMLGLYRKYDALRKIKYPESAYAFPNTNGNAYSCEWLRVHFLKCWQSANPSILTKDLARVRVYDLRHRFASAVLNQWLDEQRNLDVMLPYLQAYMGHAVLSSTAQYIHMIPENLRKSNGVEWDIMNRVIPEVE